MVSGQEVCDVESLSNKVSRRGHQLVIYCLQDEMKKYHKRASERKKARSSKT